MSKIYEKTFIKNSEENLRNLDDKLGYIEEYSIELINLYQSYSEGKKNNLDEKTTTMTSSYEDKLNKLHLCILDMYTLKNELFEDLTK